MLIVWKFIDFKLSLNFCQTTTDSFYVPLVSLIRTIASRRSANEISKCST